MGSVSEPSSPVLAEEGANRNAHVCMYMYIYNIILYSNLSNAKRLSISLRASVRERDASDRIAGNSGSKRRKRLLVLTLHAAGHNHRTCFDALERELVSDTDLGDGDTVIYHVDTPGHDEEAESIE